MKLSSFFKDNSTRKSCRIYSMLKTYGKKRHFSFHTPGHKIGKWDITELSFSDNLSCPRGCIAKAQEDVAQILHARAAFFLTDGSTSGVFSMLYAAKRLGVKKVALPSRAHKSATNACAVLGLNIRPFSSLEEIENALSQADALLLVSPDYYGVIPPLERLQTLCKTQNKLLLIDGAHGGHLHFNSSLYAGSYADMWVDGVHKSLPALTQGAVVCAKDERCAEVLREGVDIFRTTSPSYPILASIEYAVKYPDNLALQKAVRAFAFHERVQANEDWTKLIVHFGKHAFTALQVLEKRGIYAEFCDGERIVFYLSPATKKREFSLLKSTLLRLFERYPLETQPIPAPDIFQRSGKEEWIDLALAENRICARECGLFPPCTPLLVRGEKIQKEKLDLLQKSSNVYGLYQNKICVFGEEK